MRYLIATIACFLTIFACTSVLRKLIVPFSFETPGFLMGSIITGVLVTMVWRLITPSRKNAVNKTAPNPDELMASDISPARGEDGLIAMTDDAFYDKVAKEIQENRLVPGVWTRAFAEADGDESRAKAIYIKLRVAKLVSDANFVSEEPVRTQRPKKKGFGFWFLIVLFAFLAIVMLGEWVDYHQNISSKSKSAFPPSSQENTKVELHQNTKVELQKSKSFISRKRPEEGCKWTADLGEGVTMEFVPIRAGSFEMGSYIGDSDAQPPHLVHISKPFWLAQTEVTQRQYKQVMGSNPSYFQGSENPVDMVRWNDAVSFCTKLTEIERLADRLPEGFEYTLPTEAQWEYACRAGVAVDYIGSFDSMVWYDSNSGGKTHPVGRKQPNAWGLYDMLGNVSEWCSDWYDSREYRHSLATDPLCTNSASFFRVLRGGDWGHSSQYCRFTSRSHYVPDSSIYVMGFRPVVHQK